MASELTVQTLRGPTSGANADTVLIPSGQTLDASEGFIPPAGNVVQCVQYYNANCTSEATTSTSLVGSSLYKTITPTYANSLIIVQLSISMVDAIADRIKSRIRVNGVDMPGANQYHTGYQDAVNHARYYPFSHQSQYTCTSTAALEFKVYYLSDTGGSVRITHPNASAALTLWEIKQ